ncbi:MAG: ParA family protein [Candidatus Krumholzibacteriota bacterium]|nr:ParA family protein [Candidatus Krumholzibacteriota bacterium]
MHPSDTAAFLNQKGGVGKTTSVANTGAGLAIMGKRVLIVDLDPQGHLTSFLGIDRGDVETSTGDILRGEAHPHEAIVTRELGARLCLDGEESRISLSVIPATIDLADVETDLAGAPDGALLLRHAMATVADDYDYILFDCPPSLGLVTINALAAARKVFIPVQAEQLALLSLENLLRRIESVSNELGLDLVVGGLIATRYDGRKVLNRTVVQTLRERYGALLLETMVRENIALAESPRFGKDIFSYSPRSYGAADYLNLSLEVMGRIANADELFSVERGVITGNRVAEPAPPEESADDEYTGGEAAAETKPAGPDTLDSWDDSYLREAGGEGYWN